MVRARGIPARPGLRNAFLGTVSIHVLEVRVYGLGPECVVLTLA